MVRESRLGVKISPEVQLRIVGFGWEATEVRWRDGGWEIVLMACGTGDGVEFCGFVERGE